MKRTSVLLLALLMVGWKLPAMATIELDDPEMRDAYELYLSGKEDEAISIYAFKAHAGSVMAQFNLAVIYSEDRDNDLHNREFFYWLNRAADSEVRDAQFNLAMEIYSDLNDEFRLERSINWLLRAAKNGSIEAQYNLGYLAFSNLEPDITRKEGLRWLQKAVVAGDSRANKLLTMLQENQSEGAPGLYRPVYELRNIQELNEYVISADDTAVYPFPTTREEPVIFLNRGTPVIIKEKRDQWIGIQIATGFPAWVASDEIVIEGKTASVKGFEASMFVAPVMEGLVFKYGVVHGDEKLNVIGIENNWVNVYTPPYIIAWVKSSRLIRNSTDSSESSLGSAAESVEENVQQQDDENQTHNAVAIQQDSQTVSLGQSYPVYSASSETSQIKGLVDEGSQVTVVNREGDFTRIQWRGGTQGWIYGKYFDVSENTGVVTSDNVRVRLEPNTGSTATVVAKLNQGQRFPIVDAENDWYKIVFSADGDGWINL